MPQPLSGIYRANILPHVDQMLADHNLKLLNLLPHLSVRWVKPEEFADIDPNLDSLRNLNTPADYTAALAAAGLAGENR
jgi:molybdopterin-guanine dinucleotide biosynthesis protein A